MFQVSRGEMCIFKDQIHRFNSSISIHSGEEKTRSLHQVFFFAPKSAVSVAGGQILPAGNWWHRTVGGH